MANSWNKPLGCSALLKDVITIFGVSQWQGVHGQYVLEVFGDTSTSERQAIEVAWYIGAYKYRYDPQTGSW